MATLSELEAQLTPGETVDIPDEIPEERGPRQATPVPGEPYTLRLPDTIDYKPFSIEIKGKKVQRIMALFYKDPLIVVTSPEEYGGAYVGSQVFTSVSGAERKRGREGPFVSDLFYLLKALGTEMKSGQSVLAWAKALDKYAGKTFQCAIEWQAKCRADKIRYLLGEPDETGRQRSIEDPSGQFGCGTVIYQSGLQQAQDDDGNWYWPYSFACECGAVLRPSLQVVRFRPSK